MATLVFMPHGFTGPIMSGLMHVSSLIQVLRWLYTALTYWNLMYHIQVILWKDGTLMKHTPTGITSTPELSDRFVSTPSGFRFEKHNIQKGHFVLFFQTYEHKTPALNFYISNPHLSNDIRRSCRISCCRRCSRQRT